MRFILSFLFLSMALAVAQAGAWATDAAPASAPGYVGHSDSVIVEPVGIDGRDALRVTDQRSGGLVLTDADFSDGAIEVDLKSELAPNAPEGSRGFAGIAFRVDRDNTDHYEAFYIRPTNGRADAQIRRNHATQYISHPDYPWHRLREELPGHYESYADVQLGVWTHLRIEVEGEKARLYIDGAEQPALIVNDLKHGPDARGAVALWIGSGTDAYFSDLQVTH